MSISGKSCIITGAANGVGLAIAQRFAEAGARVVMADIDEANLTAAAEALRSEGFEVQSFVGDIREKLTVANLLSAAIDAHERIDVLVNASRKVALSDPLDLSEDMMTDLFERNVGANLRLTRAVATKMIKQAEDDEERHTKAGAIVNLSSIAGSRTLPGMTGFSVACAALDQLTRSLAVAFAPHGIRVNGVAIGSIKSATLKDSVKENEELRDMIIASTPAGRIGDAEEAAEAVLFLASDAASFVTGQILQVDGGRSLIDPLSMPAY